MRSSSSCASRTCRTSRARSRGRARTPAGRLGARLREHLDVEVGQRHHGADVVLVAQLREERARSRVVDARRRDAHGRPRTAPARAGWGRPRSTVACWANARDDVVALADAREQDGYIGSPAIRPSPPCRGPSPPSTSIRDVRARILRSSRSERCSTYQRSSSMRSLHGSDARPLTCAQPVMPGLDLQPAALALGVLVDLHLDRRARADDRHLAAQDVDQVRQLVERGAAQERADARDARVALVDRQAGADVLGAARPSCAA